MKIYIISGKAGSGKGEVAKLIKQYYRAKGKKGIITEFSKYLKMYAKEIIGWDGANPKPRKFLQDLGVTIKDNIGINDMLINRTIEDLKVYSLYYDVVIIADARYPEEIDKIRDNFSDVTSIYVENQFGASTLSLDEQMHITETALEGYNDFDATIINDDIEKLDNKVAQVIESSDN